MNVETEVTQAIMIPGDDVDIFLPLESDSPLDERMITIRIADDGRITIFPVNVNLHIACTDSPQ
jgi:hypothetical protein